MHKTILGECDGFTPCIDAITQELGVIPSIIFGRIWRYCQGDQEVCSASLETIATELGLSYNTVHTHVRRLVKASYLADLDAGVRNRPHRYADTGKAGLSVRISAGPQNLGTKKERSSKFGDQNGERSPKSEDRGPQNLGMKKELKKELKDLREGESAPAPAFHPLDEPDFGILETKEVFRLPEIRVYREVTSRSPGRAQYEPIWRAVRKLIIERSLRTQAAAVEYLRPFWSAWAGSRGYRPENLAWLEEWAVSGEIPRGGSKGKPRPAWSEPAEISPGITKEEFRNAKPVFEKEEVEIESTA